MHIFNMDGEGNGEAVFPSIAFNNGSGAGPSHTECGDGLGYGFKTMSRRLIGNGNGCGIGIAQSNRIEAAGNGLGCGIEWHRFRPGERPYDFEYYDFA